MTFEKKHKENCKYNFIFINCRLYYFNGNDIADDPYQIFSFRDLFQLAELINDEETNPDYRYCYYKQTADINLNNELFTSIDNFYGSDSKTFTDSVVFAGSYNRKCYKYN